MSNTKGATKRAAKRSAGPVRHHLDRRASDILAQPGVADDTLMSTKELAIFLRVSDQFLEIARSKNYGPPFVRVSARVVRYRFGDVRRWLSARVYGGTGEYPRAGAEV